MSVLLVQRSPKNSISPSSSDFESGWDIIMPAEWGMPFWKALVFAGARVSGTTLLWCLINVEMTYISGLPGVSDFGTMTLYESVFVVCQVWFPRR